MLRVTYQRGSSRGRVASAPASGCNVTSRSINNRRNCIDSVSTNARIIGSTADSPTNSSNMSKVDRSTASLSSRCCKSFPNPSELPMRDWVKALDLLSATRPSNHNVSSVSMSYRTALATGSPTTSISNAMSTMRLGSVPAKCTPSMKTSGLAADIPLSASL